MNLTKLRAKLVPYSSVVGQAVSIHDETGATVAIVTISIPDPSRDYKSTAIKIAYMIRLGFMPAAEQARNLKKAFEEHDIPWPLSRDPIHDEESR